MEKQITRIVLTGGPAAGKTTLISRILKEFKQDDGWKVITIPETATDLISGFGIKPFGNCMSMLAFQDFVVADQLHKEAMALQAAQLVPEQNILIIYDRALMDDKAYISDEEFVKVLAKFNLTEAEVLQKYDAVLHLVTCAKGAEFAYNLGNNARTESIDYAREMDDRTLRAWSRHRNLKIIDNAVDFEDKINRGIQAVYRILGEPMPMQQRHKYLVAMPELQAFCRRFSCAPIDMMQTYLVQTQPHTERRIRQQKNGADYLYFYTEKRIQPDGTKWETEKPISQKDYIQYLMEGDMSLHAVHKTKYRFSQNGQQMELDVYPFCAEQAILRVALPESAALQLPPELQLLREVTDDPAYKNRALAKRQQL